MNESRAPAHVSDKALGSLLVVAAPSGGGKTSLVNALLDSDPRMAFSVSHTTRAARPGELDGKHYHFIDDAQFDRLLAEQAFVEHATVFGNRYGTHAGALQKQLDQGFDVIVEIDWQGAAQVRAKFPDSHSVFILPPSLEVLRARLAGRGQDSQDIIDGRMHEAQDEISHWAEFDYLIVNEHFDRALDDLRAIVRSARLQRHRQQQLHTNLLAELLENG